MGHKRILKKSLKKKINRMLKLFTLLKKKETSRKLSKNFLYSINKKLNRRRNLIRNIKKNKIRKKELQEQKWKKITFIERNKKKLLKKRNWYAHKLKHKNLKIKILKKQRKLYIRKRITKILQSRYKSFWNKYNLNKRLKKSINYEKNKKKYKRLQSFYFHQFKYSLGLNNIKENLFFTSYIR